MVTRRRFFQLAAGAGAMLAVSGKASIRKGGISFDVPSAEAYYQSVGLRKFIQPLRGVGPKQIPVAVPDGTRTWGATVADHYTIDINQFEDQLHPDLGKTTLRGYNPRTALGVKGVPDQKHLGGIIIAERGRPIQLTFRNNLPEKHILPVDTTIMGADQATNRTAVHLHGGLVPWISDGGPFAWWDPQGQQGSSFVQNQVLNPGAKKKEAEYYYPMNQSARFLWYHDHAIGITRLNAYAGIATALLIRDNFERDLVAHHGLPQFIELGGAELPIIIQDKIFVRAGTINKLDPTWPGPKTTGSLWYPHIYESARWEAGPGAVLDANGNLAVDPSIVAEMFGDTMLANGTVYPEATVEARRYRLRILNACQARFLNLQLYEEQGPDSIVLQETGDDVWVPANPGGPGWLVIGTEGGFLAKAAPVASNVPFRVEYDAGGDPMPDTIEGSLFVGPAERFDIIVDFSGLAGKKFILYTDAPAPFPMGDPLNDFRSGSPNTRQIMRFKVVAATGNDPATDLATYVMAAGIDPLLDDSLSWTTEPQEPPEDVPVRQLTLNETFDSYGRLIQLLGTTEIQPDGGFGRPYDSDPTEIVSNGSIEVWQTTNMTGDTHPMHFHLVNAQLLSRQTWAGTYSDGKPDVLGDPRGPEPTEVGWKETIKMHPGEVTTVIMKFALPDVPFAVPPSPRLLEYGITGAEYVWHCHILDHEEHDMMRPLVVGAEEGEVVRAETN